MLTLLCENSAKGHHVQSVQEGQVPVMSPAAVRVFFFLQRTNFWKSGSSAGERAAGLKYLSWASQGFPWEH